MEEDSFVPSGAEHEAVWLAAQRDLGGATASELAANLATYPADAQRLILRNIALEAADDLSRALPLEALLRDTLEAALCGDFDDEGERCTAACCGGACGAGCADAACCAGSASPFAAVAACDALDALAGAPGAIFCCTGWEMHMRNDGLELVMEADGTRPAARDPQGLTLERGAGETVRVRARACPYAAGNLQATLAAGLAARSKIVLTRR